MISICTASSTRGEFTYLMHCELWAATYVPLSGLSLSCACRLGFGGELARLVRKERDLESAAPASSGSEVWNPQIQARYEMQVSESMRFLSLSYIFDSRSTTFPSRALDKQITLLGVSGEMTGWRMLGARLSPWKL